MLTQVQCLLLLAVASRASGLAVYGGGPEHAPLGSELGSRVAAHAPRLTEGRLEGRLPLPTPQELETLRKVAQILVTLGEQVLPAVIGDPPPGRPHASTQPPADVPNDVVSDV